MTTIGAVSFPHPEPQRSAAHPAMPPEVSLKADPTPPVVADQLAATVAVGDAKPEPPTSVIRLYTTYGTDQSVTLKGRVLENDPVSKARPGDSRLTNLIRNLSFLEPDEEKRVWVEVAFQGQTVRTLTDRDGMFEVGLSGFKPLAPGYHAFTARLVPGQDRTAKEATGKVVVQPQKDATLGIVSDVDDTIQYTHVSSKWEAAKTLLSGNETTIKHVPGMATLYQELDMAIDGKKDGDITYLSGSPVNYADRIDRFLKDRGFPEGPVQLKNLGLRKGEDHPFKQDDYKLKHLRTLLETYPDKPFILFGDSSEKDPEIYKTLAQEFPGRIQGIYIHHVNGESPKAQRFQGTQLISSGLDAARDLERKGLLSAAAVERVQQSITQGR